MCCAITSGGDHCEAGNACKSQNSGDAGRRQSNLRAPHASACECEARHTRVPVSALITACGAISGSRMDLMNTRRLAYWWFRFVASGRFLEKFLTLRRS